VNGIAIDLQCGNGRRASPTTSGARTAWAAQVSEALLRVFPTRERSSRDARFLATEPHGDTSRGSRGVVRCSVALEPVSVTDPAVRGHLTNPASTTPFPTRPILYKLWAKNVDSTWFLSGNREIVY
jgi:hypothetical protein